MLMPIQKSRFELESQGCRLRGFILKPEAAEPIPAVIVSHGFASCTRDTKKYAQVFVEEGYAAVCFDFCMSGSCQRQSEIVRKRRRNFVVFRRKGG